MVSGGAPGPPRPAEAPSFINIRLADELAASGRTSEHGGSRAQPDRLAQLKNPKTIHFLNGFSSAMAPALRGAPGTSEKTEIGAIAPPHARPPVQRRRPEAPARRRNRRTWENVSIFFLAWLTRDFAQNFRDARSGRDLATINRRAPWRPAATEELERKRLRSAIVPRTPSSRHPARRFARARRPSAGPRVA